MHRARDKRSPPPYCYMRYRTRIRHGFFAYRVLIVRYSWYRSYGTVPTPLLSSYYQGSLYIHIGPGFLTNTWYTLVSRTVELRIENSVYTVRQRYGTVCVGESGRRIRQTHTRSAGGLTADRRAERAHLVVRLGRILNCSSDERSIGSSTSTGLPFVGLWHAMIHQSFLATLATSGASGAHPHMRASSAGEARSCALYCSSSSRVDGKDGSFRDRS